MAHRELLLPLLGAAGVKALEVRQRSGFAVRFATARAADLPAFLDSGNVASSAMKALHFSFLDRLVLTPVEMVAALKSSLLLLPVIYLVAAAASHGFSPAAGAMAVTWYLLALLTGTFLSPLLLPWLPTRSFAVKGAVSGLLVTALVALAAGFGPRVILAAGMTTAAISSFYMLNFTGSTPYTSRSGVKREMRWALPLQGATLVLGCLLAIAGRSW